MLLSTLIMSAFVSTALPVSTDNVADNDHSLRNVVTSEKPKPKKSAREAYATERFEAQRFVEAAVEFEALWDDYNDVRDLYNAAVARQGAGHLAHAYAYLDEYLAHKQDNPNVPRETAEALREHLRTQLVPIEVEVRGKADELSFVHQGGFSSEHRDRPLVLGVSKNRRAVYLDPGQWEVQAHSESRESAEKLVTVSQGVPSSVKLQMRRRGAGEADGRKWKITAVNAGVGLGVAGVGAALWGVYQGKFDTAPGTNGESNLTALGAGLMGGGIGLGVSGLGSLAKRPKIRRFITVSQTTLGVGLLSAGAISAGLAKSDRVTVISKMYEGYNKNLINQRHDRFVGLSLLSGFGAGLVVGSVAAVVTNRHVRQRWAKVLNHVGPGFLAGGGSKVFTLSGRF